MWVRKDTPVPTAQCKPGPLVNAGVKVLLAILCAGIGGFLLSLALDTVSIFGEGLGSDARSYSSMPASTWRCTSSARSRQF